jgi:hypothetical protein
MPTVIHLALCNRSHFHFYRRSPNISQAHVPGSAGNRVKRCIAFRSAGPGVGVDNEFVRTYVSHSMLCSDSMLTSSRMGSNRPCKDTNQTRNLQSHAHNATLWNVGINDASSIIWQRSLRPSDLKFSFSSPSARDRPAYFISLSCSFVIKASHDSESARFIRFLSLWPRFGSSISD